MQRRSFLQSLPALLLLRTAWCATAEPDFSGTWKQSNERSTPPRKGNVTLRIEHHDPELTVETTITRDTAQPRHALQHYTTDGKTSVSTGADGDEFQTSAVWKAEELVFSIEEHEDGRVLLSSETWRLIDNNSALERRRQRKGSPDQTIIYLKER